jgi:hypothetical protein
MRLFGYSFIRDISDHLEAHGLSAPVRHAHRLPGHERIELIKGHIRRDQPVLVAIGNGHLRRGVYSPLARRLVGHFITVYGYSDSRECFFVYDPYLEGSYPGEIPVGNEVRSFEEFLRDWRGPLYYKWIGMDHVYLAAGREATARAEEA